MHHTENTIKKGLIPGSVMPLALKMGLLPLSHPVPKSGLPEGAANSTRTLISQDQEGPVAFLGG